MSGARSQGVRRADHGSGRSHRESRSRRSSRFRFSPVARCAWTASTWPQICEDRSLVMSRAIRAPFPHRGWYPWYLLHDDLAPLVAQPSNRRLLRSGSMEVMPST